MQDIVNEMIESDVAAGKAQQAHKAAEHAADMLEVAATTAATRASHAKIRYNQMIISLSVATPPLSASTPEVEVELARLIEVSTIPEDRDEKYCCYCDMNVVFHESAEHFNLVECDRCRSRDNVTRLSLESVGNYRAPEYCPECWKWAALPENTMVCSECYTGLSDREKDNPFTRGKCDDCAGSPCHHCGIKGGH